MAKISVNGVIRDETEAEQKFREDKAAAWNSNKNTLALQNLRLERNRKLAETDFYALSDVTMSSDMTTYRQALRDLPDNTPDPFDVTWPDSPAGTTAGEKPGEKALNR